MAYTERLKNAQIAKLKQRYIDLMEEAKTENIRQQQDTAEQQRKLYAERAMQLRDLPQQLVAEGRSGGMNDTALQQIQNAYSDALRTLQQAQQRYMEEYTYELEKQKRLMDLAVEEYLARTAPANKKSSTKSGTTATAAAATASGGNLQGAQTARRQRMESLVSSGSTAMGSGIRTQQVK